MNPTASKKLNLTEAGIAESIAGAGMLTADLIGATQHKDTSAPEQSLEQMQSHNYTIGDYDDILDDRYSNLFSMPVYGTDTFYRTPAEYAKQVMNAGMHGKEAGSAFGVWGELGGAALGTLLGGIAVPFQERESDALYSQYQKDLQRARAGDVVKMNNSLLNTRNMLTTKALGRLRAYGGELSPAPEVADFTNGVKVIENGGTHELNPYEGVPMGMDEQGIPNLVEEGEVVFNDYVFSKRILADAAILKLFNLPAKYANKDFATIAQKIAAESKNRPFDAVSKNGLIADMSALMAAQEEIKQRQREYDEYNQAEEQMQGLIAAYGGKINIKPSKKGTFTALATKKGMSLSELSDDIQAHPEKYSPEARKKEVFYRNFARKKACGGKLYAGGGNTNWLNFVEEPEQTGSPASAFTPSAYFTPPFQTIDTSIYKNPIDVVEDEVNEPSAIGLLTPEQKAKVLRDVYGAPAVRNSELLHYAAPISATAQVISDAMGATNQPDYTNADIIGSSENLIQDVAPIKFGTRYPIEPEDVNYDMNVLAGLAAGSRRSAVDLAGGNRAVALAGLQGINSSTIGAVGDTRRKARAEAYARKIDAIDKNNALEQALATNAMTARQLNLEGRVKRADIRNKYAVARDTVDTAISEAISKNLGNWGTVASQAGEDMINKNLADQYIASKGLYNQYFANLEKQISEYVSPEEAQSIILSLIAGKITPEEVIAAAKKQKGE